MARDRGKQWEKKFEEDWKITFPGDESLITRIPDQMSFYKHSSRNKCDYVAFTDGHLFECECKTHLGGSWPLYVSEKDKETGQSRQIPFRQYELMLEDKNKKNVHAGVLLWLEERDVVMWLPIQEIEKILADGIKSINPQILENKKYNILKIPFAKPRVFPNCDYHCLLEFYRGKDNGQGTDK